MKLDIVTLMAAASLVAAIAALVLGGSWVLMRDRALAWWTAASTVQSIGIATLTYGFASLDPPTIAVGGAVTATSPTLVWAGIRAFCGRRIWFPVLLAGIIVIPAAAASEFAGEAQLSARLATFSVWIVFLLAATWELWRGRRELLRARWALMTLFTLHATIFAGGIIDNLVGNENVIGVPLTLKSWFGIIHFESLIYSMGTAVFMVVMCKERSELVYRKAARIDFLTGVTNRGAFMTQAGQMFTRCRRDAVPLTVAVFDLDNFKAINDTHGHRAGDRILQVFAESALKVLRANDLLGRHGGEEFALVLPAATIETGYVIAERIRVGFSEACRQLDNPIPATLSAGVASASSETTFDTLIETADAALYRAKNLGRNRIERADAGRGSRTPNVIRVA